MIQAPLRTNELARRALLPATGLVLLVLFASRAWIGEDAHITMRTVDNFVNGFGLRWNVDERVQTYTHPLWMIVVTPAYFLTREVCFTLASIGLCFSVAAYALVARPHLDRPAVLLSAVFAPWALSKALLNYATSGFENSLTFLLLALFANELLRRPEDRPRWGRLALFAALGATNRLDAILLFAPALGWLVLRDLRGVRWSRLLAGFAPLAAWLLFSLFYHGFLFPNTAYAKLSSHIPRSIYLAQGARYLADLVLNDPVSAAMLSLGVVATLANARRAVRGDALAGSLAALGAGAALYSAYIVWIGGDFLAGRFWAAPVLLSIVVCAGSLEGFAGWLAAGSGRRRGAVAAVVVACLLLAPLGAGFVAERVPSNIKRLPITRFTITRDLRWELSAPGKYFRELGVQARGKVERGGRATQSLPVIGLAGYMAGPKVKVIDRFALGDPLLARLPPTQVDRLKPGHLLRPMPRGYISARETGSLDGMDPELAEYYGKLRLVIAGPLWSPERLATIVRFQLRAYDSLLESYVHRRRSGDTR